MAFSESPSIVVREVDLSGVVPSVSSSTGAIVGNFSWGPVHTPRKIDNEATLVSEFGAPETYNSVDFHSAAYFLKYGNSLQVVRIIDSNGVNSFTGGVGGPASPVIKSIENFDGRKVLPPIGTRPKVGLLPPIGETQELDFVELKPTVYIPKKNKNKKNKRKNKNRN